MCIHVCDGGDGGDGHGVRVNTISRMLEFTHLVGYLLHQTQNWHKCSVLLSCVHFIQLTKEPSQSALIKQDFVNPFLALRGVV